MINLQVRFIAAHNEVYILRVERENLFTFDRIARCEQKHDFRNTSQRTFLNRY